MTLNIIKPETGKMYHVNTHSLRNLGDPEGINFVREAIYLEFGVLRTKSGPVRNIFGRPSTGHIFVTREPRTGNIEIAYQASVLARQMFVHQSMGPVNAVRVPVTIIKEEDHYSVLDRQGVPIGTLEGTVELDYVRNPVLTESQKDRLSKFFDEKIFENKMAEVA